jgi:TolB-like protein/DNA-binding winged helix-turn-helix (wHTH) protein/Tfp pilus assembly protein PilF
MAAVLNVWRVLQSAGCPVRCCMASSQPSSAILCFGPYELDPAAGRLLKSGIPIKLQPQPFRVLLLLTERAGQVVTRAEIRQCVWGDSTFVDFERGINFSINQIRGALCEGAEKPQYIETIPRRGYRFIGTLVSGKDARAVPVAAATCGQIYEWPVDLGAVAAAPAAKSVARPTSISARRSTYLLAALGAALAIAVLVAWQWHNRWQVTPIRSLAVLPLQNLSGDAAQDYFADGVTDQLITDLGQFVSLRVISRTSIMQYKGVRKPLPQIARELDVDAVIEGTVLKSGNDVRITAQLIEASTDKHLWAQAYDGSLRDVLALQDEVARAIADQIRIKLTSEQETLLRRNRVVDPEAYADYLKGNYLWNKRTSADLEKAITYFQQAIERDPKYPLAHAGLSQSYALLAGYDLPERDTLAKAEAEANKALELDPNLAEPQVTLGLIAENHRWEFADAERRYKLVTGLHPNYATGHHWLGEAYLVAGRFPEALGELQRAHELDPLSLMISSDAASVFCFARQYDRCLEQLSHILDLDANFTGAHVWRALAYEGKGMFPEAILETQVARRGDDTPRALALLAHAYAQSGDRLEAQSLLRELNERSAREYVNPWDFALVYTGLGNEEAALRWLERSYRARSPDMINLKIDFRFDLLRSDRRFQDLIRRIGLPE